MIKGNKIIYDIKFIVIIFYNREKTKLIKKINLTTPSNTLFLAFQFEKLIKNSNKNFKNQDA